ncbi:hypothetical protein WA158_008215 [Blastocystis sp. Blastoise]
MDSEKPQTNVVILNTQDTKSSSDEIEEVNSNSIQLKQDIQEPASSSLLSANESRSNQEHPTSRRKRRKQTNPTKFTKRKQTKQKEISPLDSSTQEDVVVVNSSLPCISPIIQGTPILTFTATATTTSMSPLIPPSLNNIPSSPLKPTIDNYFIPISNITKDKNNKDNKDNNNSDISILNTIQANKIKDLENLLEEERRKAIDFEKQIETLQYTITSKDNDIKQQQTNLESKDKEIQDIHSLVGIELKQYIEQYASLDAINKRREIALRTPLLGKLSMESIRHQPIDTFQEGSKYYELKAKDIELQKRKEELEQEKKQLKKEINNPKLNIKDKDTNNTNSTTTTTITNDITINNNNDITTNNNNNIKSTCTSSNDDFVSPMPFCAPAPRNSISQEDTDFENAVKSEALKMKTALLKREMIEYQESLESYEYEKNIHIRELRRIRDEDSSRFHTRPIIQDRYILIRLLGKGGFSEVWLAYDLMEFREVAIKFHQLNTSWSVEKKSDFVKHALRETDIQIRLRHDHVVRLYDSIHIDDNTLATVLEYCSGPDLDQYLKQYSILKESEARSIIIQLLSALRYMHSQPTRVIHYDLKPANILFDSQGIAKISDFGLSKEFDTSNSNSQGIELTTPGAGTYWYLPPECFSSESQNPIYISEKVDVWSIGVILYQMLFGKKPFGDGISQNKIYENKIILNANQVNIPSKPIISNECRDFIIQCLYKDTKLRADVITLCKHPFITGIKK